MLSQWQGLMCLVLTAVVSPQLTLGGGEPTGACCNGEVCQLMSFDACFINGGVYQGDGTTCAGNPCDDVDPEGACCTGENCQLTSFSLCTTMGGLWQEEGTDCIGDPCGTTCPGDVNGDGMTNVDDILEVINNFGFIHDVNDLLEVIGDFGCVG